MEKLIELDREVHKSSLMQSDMFRVIKFLTIGGLLLVGADFAKKGYLEGERRFYAAKESFIASEVLKSLEGKQLKFDDKKTLTATAAGMTREQLLGVIYLQDIDLSRERSTIQHLKDILSFE